MKITKNMVEKIVSRNKVNKDTYKNKNKGSGNKKSARKFGWQPELPDQRDHLYIHDPAMAAKLPASVDLRSGMPVVYDQLALGSCTSQAIGAAFQFVQKKMKITDWIPSRLFVYYNERALEGTVNYDSGAYIRDGMKTINKQGVCPETAWPYNISKYRTKPTASCYTTALNNQSITYQRLNNADINSLKSCLASGYPFVFGFTVYDSFESDAVASTGEVPMPGNGESVLGGHAVTCCGYNDSTQRFIVRNSWGTGWGQSGYFTFPYAYMTNTSLCDDFWTLSLVEKPVKI